MDRVAAQMQREVSRMLVHDRRCRTAVHPDEALGMEGSAVTAIATCTGVELSRDMSIARVRVSIMSDDRGRMRVWGRLSRLSKYIRVMIAQKMGYLRRVPEIRLVLDDGVMEAARVMTLLDQIKDEEHDDGAHEGAGAAREQQFWDQLDAELAAEGYGEDEDFEDWEDDDGEEEEEELEEGGGPAGADEAAPAAQGTS